MTVRVVVAVPSDEYLRRRAVAKQVDRVWSVAKHDRSRAVPRCARGICGSTVRAAPEDSRERDESEDFHGQTVMAG
jgi:hypothetical protein